MDDSFLGVGQTNALAALIGLERAAATQMATNVARNNPGLEGKFVELTSDGFLDVNKESVSNRVFGRMMEAYGITKNKVVQAYKDRSSTDEQTKNNANYIITQVDNLMVLAVNSVEGLKARTSYSSEAEYKRNYKNVYLSTLGDKSNDELRANI